MTYVIPPLLHVIRREADLIAPTRSHASDGTIGDPAHQHRTSDHNPDARGIVHAIDLTHDPQHGFDARAEGEALRRRCYDGTERRVKYLVSYDGKRDIIASPVMGWAWRRHRGTDHRTHLHISIRSGPDVENSTQQMLRPQSHLTKPPEVHVPKVYSCAAPGGYYQVSATGAVYAFGVPYFGGWNPMPLGAPINGIAPYVVEGTVKGYWLFGEDGGVLTFGEAPFLGTAHGIVV